MTDPSELGQPCSVACPWGRVLVCVSLQVVKDHIKLTMTGPASALGEDNSPEELRDSYITVLVARHFEAMWTHMRSGLDSLPAPHHRLMDQVSA